ncbi:MAG: response regulator [Gemmatimonadaceae bacterium]
MPQQPLRILVVDDNHDNAEIVRAYLESTNDFAVTVAHDGDEAIARYHDSPFDVILLDVMMPGRDGWDVCRAIKSEPERAQKTRVIMLTARDQLADRRIALQSGADDFLEKPLELAKLLTAVRRNAAALAGSVKAPTTPAAPVTPPTQA